MEVLDFENIPENSEIVEVVKVEPNEDTNVKELISTIDDK